MSPCHRPNGRVNECGHECREDQVAPHLKPLRDAPGNDRSSGHAESPLEEPVLASDQMIRPDEGHLDHGICRRVHHPVSEEASASVDPSDNLQRGAIVALAHAAVHEGVAAEEPQDRAEAGVQHVLKEHRLAGHGSAHARFQKGEASVHEKHQRSAENRPRRTHRRSDLRDEAQQTYVESNFIRHLMTFRESVPGHIDASDSE